MLTRNGRIGVFSVVVRVAGTVRGTSTVLSSVMVVLRLSVARTSRLVVAACAYACAGVEVHIATPRA
jgi:hypothetical protein